MQSTTVIIDGISSLIVTGNSVLPAKKRDHDIAERTKLLARDTQEPKRVPKEQWYASPARKADPEVTLKVTN